MTPTRSERTPDPARERPGVPPDSLLHDQRRARRPQVDAPLRRSRSDRRLAGIAGGIAVFTGARPTTVRLLWALSLPLTGGVSGLGYLVLWAILPLEHRA